MSKLCLLPFDILASYYFSGQQMLLRVLERCNVLCKQHEAHHFERAGQLIKWECGLLVCRFVVYFKDGNCFVTLFMIVSYTLDCRQTDGRTD
jgi:hypothetical protein